MPARVCILLQGPVGGFFTALKRRMRQAGYVVLKVNFNCGDAFNGSADDVTYDGPMEAFAAWLRALMIESAAGLVVGFGDQRHWHRIARALCRELGVPIFFFEEGYIRPGFVSFEREGSNASSLMSACELDPDETRREAAGNGRGDFRAMATSAVAYWLAMRLGRARFPYYRHHYENTLRREAWAWLRLGAHRVLTRSRSRKLAASLLRPGAPAFALLLLQLDTDFQIRAHGHGWRSATLLETVAASFEAHADPDMLLVVKAHPFERSLNHARMLRACATRFGLAERTVLLHQGPFEALVAAARSVVTVNSTGGLGALDAGVPVLTLGSSMYTRPGLAVGQGDLRLDSFWRGHEPPDRRTWMRFRNHLLEHVLCPGSFYERASWDGLCDGVLRRLAQQPEWRQARASAPEGIERASMP